MPNQIELKDAEQDQEIALLKHRVEQLEKSGDTSMVDELRDRVRKLEKWVWGCRCCCYRSDYFIRNSNGGRRQGDELWEQ